MTNQSKLDKTKHIPISPQISYKSILIIWLFLFIGFIIIVWFGVSLMRQVAAGDPKAAYVEGKRLYDQGKKAAAFKKFLTAVENDTTNFQAYFYLGKLSWEKKEPEQTVAYLRQFQKTRFGYIVPGDIAQNVTDICQQVGGYYIEQQNWQNARLAYDIAGNIAFDVCGYLQNLEKQFDDPVLITARNKIWPDGIAVTLEDFENSTQPVLRRWITNPAGTIESHTIVHNPVHRGNNAELLKIRYTSAGPDYWAKNTYIVLQAPLAIRVYVTGKQNTRCQLVANMRYAKSRPEQKMGLTGACYSNEVILTKNQWIPLIIPDVYTIAMNIARDPRWQYRYNPKLIQLETIGINTFSNDCELYIDDIEVYLPQP
jgi:tetratricopeptide (TPR) repeat protein